MRKVLANTPKTRKFLETLPKIYLIGFWADYGIREHYFTGKYKDDIPLVYDYDDHNGTDNSYYLRKITHTTTGTIIYWTTHKILADMIVKGLKKDEKSR